MLIDKVGGMDLFLLSSGIGFQKDVYKRQEVHQDLQAQFANRSIKKRYVAVLDGAIIKTEKETKPIAEKAIFCLLYTSQVLVHMLIHMQI